MTVDQSNGYLYIVYYDRRNHADNHTDVYLSVSKDGGTTFSDYKISENPFYPNPKMFFGDYTNISACNGVVRPIWTHLDGTKISLFTALVQQEKLEVKH